MIQRHHRHPNQPHLGQRLKQPTHQRRHRCQSSLARRHHADHVCANFRKTLIPIPTPTTGIHTGQILPPCSTDPTRDHLPRRPRSHQPRRRASSSSSAPSSSAHRLRRRCWRFRRRHRRRCLEHQYASVTAGHSAPSTSPEARSLCATRIDGPVSSTSTARSHGSHGPLSLTTVLSASVRTPEVRRVTLLRAQRHVRISSDSAGATNPNPGTLNRRRSRRHQQRRLPVHPGKRDRLIQRDTVIRPGHPTPFVHGESCGVIVHGSP